MIEIVPVLDLAETNKYVEANNLVEVIVDGIEDFYFPSPSTGAVRWFVRLQPAKVTTASKRKSLLRNEFEPAKSFIRKNIRFPIELFKRLEASAGQKELHVSDMIVSALQEHFGDQ